MALEPETALNRPFQYCPVCGAKQFRRDCEKSWRCGACDFVLYMNPGAAVAAIIEHRGEILFAVRAGDPCAGMLDLPGGFVDNDETAEQALQRELDEELGLRQVRPAYLASFPNVYSYGGVDYRTIDFIYHVKLDSRPELRAADDVAAVRWIAADAIPFDQVAFASIREALRHYLAAGADRA